MVLSIVIIRIIIIIWIIIIIIVLLIVGIHSVILLLSVLLWSRLRVAKRVAIGRIDNWKAWNALVSLATAFHWSQVLVIAKHNFINVLNI